MIKKVRAMQSARDSENKKLDAFIPSILDRAFRGAL